MIKTIRSTEVDNPVTLDTLIGIAAQWRVSPTELVVSFHCDVDGTDFITVAWMAENGHQHMYRAHVGVGWSPTFATYEEAARYVRHYGLPPAAFVELNFQKGTRS